LGLFIPLGRAAIRRKSHQYHPGSEDTQRPKYDSRLFEQYPMYESIIRLEYIADNFTSIDKSHLIIADFYATTNGSSSLAASHRNTAASLKTGIMDLLWDSSKLGFYDYNLTSNARNSIYTAATFYPLWNGIIPNELLSNSSNAFGYFAGINLVLSRYNGTFPSTFLTTGLQWYVATGKDAQSPLNF
jgi:alpha,alpha-trehalase